MAEYPPVPSLCTTAVIHCAAYAQLLLALAPLFPELAQITAHNSVNAVEMFVA
jgi:hypothetical protein